MLRYGGVSAGFLTQLILARLLTPESLGLFFAGTSMAAIAAALATFGYSEIVPRFFSRYQARGRIDIFVGFTKHCHRDIMSGCIVASGLILAGAFFWPGTSLQERSIFVSVAIWIPFLAYLDYNSWIALSLRSFFLAYVPESFLSPVIFLMMVATLFFLGFKPDALVLIIAFATTSGILCIGLWLLLRPLIPKIKNSEAKAIHPRIIARWRREGALQIPTSIYTVLFTDLAILTLALLLPASDLAAFAIALKIAMLVGFVVQVAHQVIIPELADAHAERRFGQSGKIIGAAATFPIALTTIALVGAVLIGDRVLTIFHPDFAMAHGVLVILIGCQLLRALAGPVVQLLTIAGAQLHNACLCIVSMVILAIASLLFVPSFGMIGAAYAIFVTWLSWLSASAITLKILTGLRCDILAVMAEPPIH